MNSDPNLPIALSIIRDECGRHSRCRECPLQDKCIINPNGLIPRCWEIPDPPPEPTERQCIEWLRCLPDEEMLKAMDTFSFENCCFGDDDKAEEYITVSARSIWEKTDDSFIGGDIHLDSEDGLSWIEISNEELEKYFRRAEK